MSDTDNSIAGVIKRELRFSESPNAPPLFVILKFLRDHWPRRGWLKIVIFKVMGVLLPLTILGVSITKRLTKVVLL